MEFALLDGKRVRASANTIRGLDYKCPYVYCKSPGLGVRIGNKKRPHFYHLSGKPECDSLSEGMTEAHFAMRDTM